MSRIPPPIPFRRFRPGRALALCLGLAWAASLAGAAFLKTWVPQRFLEADEVLVRCAASPEGRMLAIQQQSGAIRLVDLDRRETVKVVPRLADGIACLALGPEGEVLVAGAGRDVYALDLAGGGPPRRLWHGGKVSAFGDIQVFGVFAKISFRRRFGSIGVPAVWNFIQIKL